MGIIIGTVFLGKVNKVNDQCIESKFFILGIPLFPISSMYVLSSSYGKRQGFDIPVNGRSVLQGYGLIFLPLLFIGTLFLKTEFRYESVPLFVLNMLAALFAILFTYLLMVRKNERNSDHLKDRKRLGFALEINALPEMLPNPVFNAYFNVVRQEVIGIFGENFDIQNIVRDQNVKGSELAKVYAYLRYNQRIQPSKMNSDLMRTVQLRLDKLIYEKTNDASFAFNSNLNF
jgi:hypothetical protein